MKVLACADDVGLTIAEIRIGLPLGTLAAQRGWSLALRNTIDVDSAALAAADVLVVQRPVTRRAAALVRRMRASGGRVICELDDLLTEPAPHLQGYARALRLAPHLHCALGAADVVSAATARLAQALGPLARTVRVVPNYAMPNAPLAATWNLSGPLHFLLAASDHMADSELPAALLRLFKERPGRAQLVAIGPAAQPLLAQGLPTKALPLMPRMEFLSFAASLPQVVALIPLGRTRFDACKSAIKYFDYSAAGVPVVCSDVPPYSDVIEDGRTGRLVADEPEAWARALLELVDHPSRARLWTEAAGRDVAARHSLMQTTAAWASLIDELGPRNPYSRIPPSWRFALSDGVLWLQRLNRARLARRRVHGPPSQDNS